MPSPSHILDVLDSKGADAVKREVGILFLSGQKNHGIDEGQLQNSRTGARVPSSFTGTLSNMFLRIVSESAMEQLQPSFKVPQAGSIDF